MMNPKNMSAREWRDWVYFCAKEGKIDATKLRGNQAERDGEYEKAWRLAEAYAA